MNFDVFISYSTKDAAIANAACAVLEAAKSVAECAQRDIMPSGPWGTSIVKAIDECPVMVLIFSGNANASAQVHREVDRVFSKGVAVVPLRVENVVPDEGLAYYLDTVHWLDALTPPLGKILQKLVAMVQALSPLAERELLSERPAQDEIRSGWGSRLGSRGGRAPRASRSRRNCFPATRERRTACSRSGNEAASTSRACIHNSEAHRHCRCA